MKNWIIDGNTLQSRRQLHAMAADALTLPDYYGHNLDALFDCLCECGEDTTITVQNTDALLTNLGHYSRAFLCLLERAGQDNPHLTVIIEPEDA